MIISKNNKHRLEEQDIKLLAWDLKQNRMYSLINMKPFAYGFILWTHDFLQRPVKCGCLYCGWVADKFKKQDQERLKRMKKWLLSHKCERNLE